MSQDHTEIGGLRWGASYWKGTNASWPFARLRVTPETISVSIDMVGFGSENFVFTRAELTRIKKKKGILPFSTGIIFEHTNSSYPPFILFWTLRYARLRAELLRFGFSIAES